MTSSGPALVTAIDASGDDQAYTYDALCCRHDSLHTARQDRVRPDRQHSLLTA